MSVLRRNKKPRKNFFPKFSLIGDAMREDINPKQNFVIDVESRSSITK